MDNILLNYHDSLLYESDLELLNQGNWLNDRLIGFIYEYLERDEFEIECGERNRFSFVNPSTVQYLKLCESLNEASCCFLDPLCLDKKDVIFFPLNNNNETQVAGGSHWSLLVFYRKSHLLVHYDSTGSNRNEAVKFFRKYKDYFGLEEIQVEKEFPKQTNSSDCGVYLLGKNTKILILFLNSVNFFVLIYILNFYIFSCNMVNCTAVSIKKRKRIVNYRI